VPRASLEHQAFRERQGQQEALDQWERPALPVHQVFKVPQEVRAQPALLVQLELQEVLVLLVLLVLQE